MTDTPTTEEIRREWAQLRADGYALVSDNADQIALAEFDAWLANVKADTLMDARHLVIGTPGFQALTDRAAEIRGDRP